MNRKAWLALVMVLCLSFPALAQKITVSGTVTDPTGEPLIGASVLVQGTSNGVATDIDGNYQIAVDANGTLVVSYVGYETQNVAINGQTTVNVVLQENSVVLSEVVAIGYGAVKKSDATGSVAVIKPDEIEAGISTSAQDMLVGASPGVVVTTDGGNPTGGAAIRIRGGASLSASNDPLIVIDGVPMSGDSYAGANPLTMISPDNIESMTILKDASATAIYGSRASNGVIIITTKKGQSGAPQVNFTANMHVNTARKTWDVMSGDEFREMVMNQIGTESAIAQLGDANTNWQDEVLRTSISQDYSLSVGGTAGILPYRVSASYTNNQGILKTSGMDRTTVGFKLTPKFFDGHLSVLANANGAYIKTRQADTGAVGTALTYNPTLPVYSGLNIYNGYTTLVDASGKPLDNSPNNPLAMLESVNNVAEVLNSNGNLQLDYALHFLPELRLNLNLGYEVSENRTNSTTAQNSPQSWRGNYYDGAGTVYNHYDLKRNTVLEFYANYKKEVEAIKSNFDVILGYSWERRDYQGHSLTTFNTTGYNNNWSEVYADGVYNLVEDPATADRIGHSYNDQPTYYWKGQLNLISFYGRLNYALDNKYLLTFTLRDDGTSRFSPNTRWGLFPALALGWKISEMGFFESAKSKMNEFKLRLGWGVTGQQAVGGYYPYIPVYAQSTSSGVVNYPSPDGKEYDWISPLYPKAYQEDLKWEETTTWNVGVDMAWLNNRITASLDWYLRDTKDLLAYVPVPAGMTTTNFMDRNIGELRNIGVEANIGAKPVVTKDFTWSTAINAAWNKNELTKLTGSNEEDQSYYLQAAGNPASENAGALQVHKAGHPAYSFYLLEQVYDKDGNPIPNQYVDQNQDGEINDADLVIRHSRDPKVTLSWNNTFNYKNWDLGIQLRSNIGNYVFNSVRASKTNLTTVDRYGLNNLIKADFYFNDASANSNLVRSDYFLEDASFVRCDNITLGYTWNELLNNNLRLRLFGAVQNPFVITNYKGLDPEVFSGVDNNVYPRPVTVTLGLVATF
ncbi:MAG: TonB-dependent receptor [Muribaculaceae bacterium]|nr:TonB-dependent receptor [Muribaculaceae bacterium]